MSCITDTTALLSIAERAIEIQSLKDIRHQRQQELSEAYSKYKTKAKIDYADRTSIEWIAIQKATNREFSALEDAKKSVRNAEKRLKAAVRKYKAGAA